MRRRHSCARANRRSGNLSLQAACSARLLTASGGATVVREYLHGSGVILTIHGKRRVLCTRVKIMPAGTHEVRVGRAVAPVASLAGRYRARRKHFIYKVFTYLKLLITIR